MTDIPLINCIFKCDRCGALIEKQGEKIECAKNYSFEHNIIKNFNICPSTPKGTFRYYTVVGTPISDRFNKLKLDNIKNSTCKGCKLNPDKCAKLPEMLAICQVESLEYRLRSGKYNISSGTGAGEFSKDIKGVIIDGTPVYVEDIKRLFVARWDTYSLYNLEDRGKETVRAPESSQPPTDDVILRCLMGDITIGFRPVDPETNICKWLCYDVDKHSCEGTVYAANPRDAVDEIVKRLNEWYNLTGYTELSGSPDSYHIWVFIEPIDYEIVLKFDESFKARCDPLINQAICKRIEKGDGRMIRMVYSINIKNGNRSRFIDGIDISKIQPEKLPIIEPTQTT